MTDERAIEDRIRARAHEIWEREGRPEGHGPRHWDEARLEIEAEERVTSEGSSDISGDEAGGAMLDGPAPAPDLPPEAGQGAPGADVPGADLPVETEASPSELERAPT